MLNATKSTKVNLRLKTLKMKKLIKLVALYQQKAIWHEVRLQMPQLTTLISHLGTVIFWPQMLDKSKEQRH